jgi:predicted nucleotidyltransferase
MESIFSTKQRITILQAIIFTTDNVSVNNIANKLKLSKGLVSKYFDILAKKGVLKREKGKLSVSDNSLVKAIKIFLNVGGIDPKIFKKYPFVTAAGLYGSCARGENTNDSDTDIWIRVKKVEETKVASLTVEVNRKIRNAKVLIIDDSKMEKIREEDIMFYHSLSFGSIILYGDENALQI